MVHIESWWVTSGTQHEEKKERRGHKLTFCFHIMRFICGVFHGCISVERTRCPGRFWYEAVAALGC